MKEPTHFEALYPARARFGEIEKIFQYLKEGSSCQLIGIPGVGRGNILNLLAYNRAIREAHVGENQKWFHFVGIDFSEARNRPLLEVMKLIFLELVDSLHERKIEDAYEKTREIFKDALSFQDELILFQGLKTAIDYLAIEKELTIVFLFDRFEEYIPMLTSTLFSNLRVLRNRAKYRFSVVFSLGRPLEESIDPSILADYYEFFIGHTIYVSLDDTPTTDFRISYLEKVSGKTLDKQTISKILALTGGHGKLTRLCIETVLQSNEVSKDVFLSKKHIQGALLEIWNYLTAEEQQDIEDYLKKGSVLESNFLQYVDLVKNGKLTIPLFESFLRKTPSNFVEQRIFFDQETNTIKKGAVTLSDSLTAAEFKLLALLLREEGKVVSRDDVIAAVWKNTASTAGVTEQALDQLIFRLRRKIEDDPTNPTHILTVKGRGIVFNQ